MACIVMAYMIMAYIVLTLNNKGLTEGSKSWVHCQRLLQRFLPLETTDSGKDSLDSATPRHIKSQHRRRFFWL